jgi:tyrosyl-tRNA synthetase
MSKSYGNYIGINDTPQDMFGKIMSVSDELMMQYYELLTTEDLDAVKAKHPMQAKKDLAALLVTRFHGQDGAKIGLEHFESVFSKKENPQDMPEAKVEAGTLVSAVIVQYQIAKSKNEARRLIDQGGVKLDGNKVEQDIPLNIEQPAVLQVGKRHFLKLIK